MAFLVSLLACTSSGPDIVAGSPVKPDVILVSIDTLRADHLSSYGYERETSPFLDSLAALILLCLSLYTFSTLSSVIFRRAGEKTGPRNARARPKNEKNVITDDFNPGTPL